MRYFESMDDSSTSCYIAWVNKHDLFKLKYSVCLHAVKQFDAKCISHLVLRERLYTSNYSCALFCEHHGKLPTLNLIWIQHHTWQSPHTFTCTRIRCIYNERVPCIRFIHTRVYVHRSTSYVHVCKSVHALIVRYLVGLHEQDILVGKGTVEEVLSDAKYTISGFIH